MTQTAATPAKPRSLAIAAPVVAMLGPTNTGKTHYALDRMASHRSGLIGLPLRLLAREVYQKLVVRVGAQNVALVTGEEKVTPPQARYTVCTVEAMPRETRAEFVAIDEVQLAADLGRGHVFTDRILNLRGLSETLLLGSSVMEPLLRLMIPDIRIESRPRFSTLAYAGSRKITRLPRRSAIVAFSADEVYSIAELVRRQKGGAAIVMGALSPRTRNAQVELYQNSDVDYLVATDAIGMGLNLDVDHVAFAQDQKFDGFVTRPLTPVEIAQIGGRAGRHTRDGTFGVTANAAPLDDEIASQIEAHDFEPYRMMQWRSGELDFSSVEHLIDSLDRVPPTPGLTRALPATDQRALEFAIRDDEIRRMTDHPSRVKRLWDVCALPDYRKIAPAQHAEVVIALYRDLCKRGHVDADYMAEQVARADRTDGEIDTLSQRVAQIRTWTYVSHQPGWLKDAEHWREQTRAIEDRLSDALHERLTQRFVDRRTSVLMKRLRENAMLEATVDANGQVTVEGHVVGTLAGFRFTSDAAAGGADQKAVEAAALKALALEFEARAARFSIAPNGDLSLGSDGKLRWLGAAVAALAASDNWLSPRAVLLVDEQITGPSRDRIQTRVDRFIAHHIETLIKPLLDLRDAEQLQGMGRGLAFRLAENQGIVARRDVAEDLKSIDKDGRAALRRYGVRFGFYNVFVPALFKPAPAELITLLWALKTDALDAPGYGDPVSQLAAGRTSFVPDAAVSADLYRLAGYQILGSRAVRIDILERLADLIRPALFWKKAEEAKPEGALGEGAFHVTPAMMSILGATPADMEAVLSALGYRSEAVEKEAFDAQLAKVTAEAPVKSAAPDKPQVAIEIKPKQAGHAAPASSTATGEDSADAAEEAGETAPTDNGDHVATAADTTPSAGESEEAPAPVLIWRQGRAPGSQRGRAPGNARPATGRQDARKDGKGARRDHGRGQPGGEKSGKGGKPFSGKSGGPRDTGRPGGQAPGNKGGNKSGKPRVERPVDPDSPFAKLAALKEQLKKP